MKYETTNHEVMNNDVGGHWKVITIVLVGAIFLLFALMFFLVLRLQLYPPQVIYPQVAAVPEVTPTQPITFSVGDVAIVGNFAVTLNSVRWGEEGRWLILEVSLANIGEYTEFVSSGMYSLYDENNHSRGGMALGSEMELEAGNETGGEILFNVEPGHSSWRFVFNADYFYSPLFGQVTFLINIDDIYNMGEGEKL